MPLFRYFREVFRLLLNASDNPVVRHARPWAGRGFGRFFWWLQLAAATAAAAAIVWLHVSERWDQGEVIMASIVGMVALGTGVAVPANLLLYASAWSDRERLEEIWLTTIPARDVAFGSVYWPLVGGAIVPCAGWLAYVACVFARPDDWLILWNGFEPWALVLAIVAGCFYAGGAAIGLSYWFLCQRNRWRVVLMTPAMAFLGSVWTFLGAAAVVASLDELTSLPDESSVAATACVFAPAYVLVCLRVAGRLAVARFWSPVFPEPLRRLSVFDCARHVRQDAALKRWTRDLLRRWIPMPIGRSVMLWFGAAVLLAAIEWTVADPPDYVPGIAGLSYSYNTIWNPWFLTLHYVLCLVLATLADALRFGFDGFKVVPGRPLASLERRFWIFRAPYIAIFFTGSWFFLAVRGRFDVWWEYVLPLVGFAFAAAFLSSLLIGLVGWAASSRRPALAFAGIATWWLAALGTYLWDDHVPNQPFWHTVHNADSMLSVFSVGMWFACTLAGLAFQRMHTRALQRMPAWGENPFEPPRAAPPPQGSIPAPLSSATPVADA